MMTAIPDDDDSHGVSLPSSPKNDGTALVLRLVRYIESIQVPWTTKSLVIATNDGPVAVEAEQQQQQQQQPVYLISGLERCLGLTSGGNTNGRKQKRQAAADVVLIGGISPPRYLFYVRTEMTLFVSIEL